MSGFAFLVAWFILKNNHWFNGEPQVAKICLIAAIVCGAAELLGLLFGIGVLGATLRSMKRDKRNRRW